MSKKNKRKSYNTTARKPARPATAPKPTRREMIRSTAMLAGIGAVILGGIGYVGSGVYADIVEQDLSKLGNGLPTIVQIHDPQCSRCRSLQREARDALAEIPDGKLQYLVANIRNGDGKRFADKHGVGHVTLILFDGAGKARKTLVGERTSDALLSEFRRLVAISNQG
ncbi:MAG: hypothetical protein AAF557_10020 [Pseudomonadota bacterium]